jgi:hypothetical protein
MNDDERRAYARGYNAAKSNRWPEHKPPAPPEPIIRKLLDALCGLRDAADAICATLDGNDEFVVRLGPWVDSADEATTSVTWWLRENGSDGECSR